MHDHQEIIVVHKQLMKDNPILRSHIQTVNQNAAPFSNFIWRASRLIRILADEGT